ncbi:response regulator [Patescibacteria group bacterium]|nr:response regulator [Patescibacteria group bacterium]
MKKILFIDDQAEILELLSELLSAGPNVVFSECHDFESAMKAIQKEKPDVVFTDHSLSGGGGEGLKIVETLSGSGVKVISITSDENAGAAYELIGVKHVNKQDTDELKKIIDMI